MNIEKKTILLCVVAAMTAAATLYANTPVNFAQKVDSAAMNQWVDSVMQTLSPNERLGQLIMSIVQPTNTPEARETLKTKLKKYPIGGILWQKGTLKDQAVMTNYVRRIANQPFWIALDGEWGLAMRLRDAPKFPRNGVLGKISGEYLTPSGIPLRDSLMYAYGLEVARECREMSIDINFAPVMDVNSNPKNPVIGNRSWGDNVADVVSCGLSYSAGLENGGVMAVAKHFPGHGDTDTDSHKTLPVISHDRARLDTVELRPFSEYIRGGFSGMMSAHLEVPALGSMPGEPSSVSKKIINGILRDSLGFEGIVFTDGLAMAGAAVRDVAVKALLAGNDILLDPVPLPAQWKSLLAARKDGRLPQSLIDEKCRKVLRYKYMLMQYNPPHEIETEGLENRVNSPESRNLIQTLTDLSNGKVPAMEEYDPTDQPVASDLPEIDRLIQKTIAGHGTPGCEILFAKDGKIVFQQNYGRLAYGRKNPKVNDETLYDLASMTKALATTPAVMLLIDNYGVRLDDKVMKYVPALRGTHLKNITIRQLLFHETGLPAFYPFYKQTGSILTKESDRNHTMRICDNMWVSPAFRSMMLTTISSLQTRSTREPLYSDLNFVLLRAVIEKVTEMRMDEFVEQKIYRPLGCKMLGYLPVEHGYDKSNIAPTEQDNDFRMQLCQGWVHDETAAVAGGVEGNAGLFGCVNDIYKVVRMLADDGKMENGEQLIKAETVQSFVKARSKGVKRKRALGFSLSDGEHTESSNVAKDASEKTWGHTGFTGTCFWVDPEAGTIYIFLSNRINPTRNNRELLRGNVRTRVMQSLYEAFVKEPK